MALGLSFFSCPVGEEEKRKKKEEKEKKRRKRKEKNARSYPGSGWEYII